VRVAFVVQRYGQAVNGGAELHARYIAERLAKHAEVEVLTTCATDYVTWKNELPAGVERVNNVTVRRFRVKHERDPIAFGRLSERVFEQLHSVADELDWLDAEGPTSPALIDHVAKHASDYDFLIFFSYRYYHAYYGVRAATSRAILVPTAERDSTIGLSIFASIFRSVRGLMYNSPEERAMIQGLAANQDVPSVVVGVGSEVPTNTQPGRFRQKFDIRGPFAVYVGRIDENKGCQELFQYFDAYLGEGAGRLTLVLIGNSLLDIPKHPRIRHLGFLEDVDKFDAIAAAELLIMPSYFESLSMVALEAWALGRPVLANAKCDVLKGQCIRSNAGLYYDGQAEFVESLRAIEHNRWLAASLGKNGRQYYRDHYDWPVIERKYLEMIDRLSKSVASKTIDPIPGWFGRQKVECPPGSQVVAALPSGPSITEEAYLPRPEGVVSPPLPERAIPPRRQAPAEAGLHDRPTADAAPDNRLSAEGGPPDRRDRRDQRRYGRPRRGGGHSRPGGGR
jgi:glycosyltransferase involved in cell wall biosynthesis